MCRANFEIFAFKVTSYRLGIPFGYDITSWIDFTSWYIIYICEYQKTWNQHASHRDNLVKKKQSIHMLFTGKKMWRTHWKCLKVSNFGK